MVSININGRQIEVDEGQTILDVAREYGIDIPTLCYHEAVSSAGACRLCLVEITKNGRSKIVASCLYPVEDGLNVITDSDCIIESRKMVIELLLASCPNSAVIQEMAEKLGVEKTEFIIHDKDKDNECILCGLCVRACDEIVGVNAISLVNRGNKREVATPFHDVAQTCIGCGSCHYICPTGAIKMEDIEGIRKIYNWNVEFNLKKCKSCGNYFATESQLDYIKNTLELSEPIETCISCR